MPIMRPLVVIPTYNESENIERMLHRIHECLPGAGVLVVDDGSPDGTADIVKAVAAELPDVHLLARNEKSGSGQRVPGRVRLGARAGLRRVRRDRCGLLPRPRGAAGAAGAARGGVRRLDRLALHRGRVHPELGLAPPPAVAGRQHLRLDCAGPGSGRLPRRGTGRIRPGSCASWTSSGSGPRDTASRSR